MNCVPLFEFARKRHQIYLKRQQGIPKPWTDDPILQQYRFCNVYRELDKVTVWFKNNYRNRMDTTVFGCLAFRFFNRISTGEILLKEGLLDEWDPKQARKALKDVQPLVGGAYIINTSGSPGKKKLEGLIDILNPVWKAQQAGQLNFRGWTLQAATERLAQFWFVGNFMAYQAVADIRYTPILENARDIMTWGMAGPGTARGLARVLEVPIKTFHYGNTKGQEQMLPHLRSILKESNYAQNWPLQYRALEMQDVTNLLCEFDKFERVRLGEGEPKQRYPGI